MKRFFVSAQLFNKQMNDSAYVWNRWRRVSTEDSLVYTSNSILAQKQQSTGFQSQEYAI